MRLLQTESWKLFLIILAPAIASESFSWLTSISFPAIPLSVDWDPVIAEFNLDHLPSDKLDMQFLFWLNDHTLPVLVKHKELIEDAASKKFVAKEETLTYRIQQFNRNYQSRSWQSFNYADYRVYRFLMNQPAIKP